MVVLWKFDVIIVGRFFYVYSRILRLIELVIYLIKRFMFLWLSYGIIDIIFDWYMRVFLRRILII